MDVEGGERLADLQGDQCAEREKERGREREWGERYKVSTFNYQNLADAICDVNQGQTSYHVITYLPLNFVSGTNL